MLRTHCPGRVYAPSGGHWRRGHEVRQARPNLRGGVRRGGPGRGDRRRALPQRGPGALLRQPGRERDREAAPHPAPGRLRPPHPHPAPDPGAPPQQGNPRGTGTPEPPPPRPPGLYDPRPPPGGGAALRRPSGEVARRHKRPIWVLGSAAASDYMLLHDKKDLSRVPANERAAAAAYRQAGVGPEDVDVVELHDCFTIAEIVATEGLGLFEPGAGGIAAEKGWTSLGGQIPVNPSGGLKAKGHPIGATGAAQICEVVTQLRGEAGPRQGGGARAPPPPPPRRDTPPRPVSPFGPG